MNPEERSLLENTYKMVEENNTILRSIRRSSRIGTVMKVVYWVIILALSFGSYYLIQPYINAMTNALNIGGRAAPAQQSQSSTSEYLKSFQDLIK